MSKIFDAHMHIYPERIAGRAVDSLGRFYDFVPQGKGTLDECLSDYEKVGCCGFIALGVATNAYQVCTVNEYVAKCVKASRERGFDAYGFMGMHQDFDDIEGELLRAKALGLSGAKIHPDLQGVDILDRRLYPLYELLAGHGMTLYFHVGDCRPQYRYSEPERVARIAREFPSLRIGAAHLGGYTVFDEGTELLRGIDNVWTDCSSALWLMSAEEAGRLIRRFGAERVMFATDYPVMRCEAELARFDQIDLTDRERELIFYENSRDFLGLR